jgi:hypothetical protein
MGVPIVFHHVGNQPHTSSPHFARFPYGLPDHLFMVLFFYLQPRRIMNSPFHPQSVCPSANLSSFHQLHIETHPWGPHPSSSFQTNSSLPGAHISHWGTRFCICTFSPKLFIIYCTNVLYFPSLHFLLSSPLATCFILATRNPCHPWLEHCFSSTLAGIVHIFRVLPRSLTSTLCIGSPCPASGTTYRQSCRPPDTRPCYTVATTFHLIHPPTKGNLESSHFLTSSMYLCHFLTSVASMKPFASGSRVPLLSTTTHFFQKGDSILILILHLMRDIRRHRVKHHCSLLLLAPITFDTNTFSCYGGSYFATIAVLFIIRRRPQNMVGPSMPTSSSLLITAIITYCSEYIPLQNCLLPLSSPPSRALQLSTPTLPSSFFRVT